MQTITKAIAGNQLCAMQTEIKLADSLASIQNNTVSDLFAVLEKIVADEAYQTENVYTCLQHFHVSCRYVLLTKDEKFIKVMNSHWQKVRYLIANDLMLTIPKIDPTTKRTTNCWVLMKSPRMKEKIFREGPFRATLLHCAKSLPSFESVTSCEIPLNYKQNRLDRWLEILELVDLSDHPQGKEIEDYILGVMPPQFKHCFSAESIDLQQAQEVCAIFEVLSLAVQIFRDDPTRTKALMQILTRIHHICPVLRSTVIGLVKPHLLVLRPFLPKDMNLKIDQQFLNANSLFLATIPEFNDCLMQASLQHDFQQLWSKEPKGQVTVDCASLVLEEGSSFKQYLRITEAAEAFAKNEKISAEDAKEIVADLPEDRSILLLDIARTHNLLHALNRIFYVFPENRDTIANFFANRNIASLLPHDAVVNCEDGESIKVNSIVLQRIPYYRMLLSASMKEAANIERNWLDLETAPIKVESSLAANVVTSILAFISSGDKTTLETVHPVDLWFAGDVLAVQDQEFYHHVYSNLISYVMRGTDEDEIQSVLRVVQTCPDHQTNFAALKALCVQRLEMLQLVMDESVQVVENNVNIEQPPPVSVAVQQLRQSERKKVSTKSKIKSGIKKFFKN